MASVDALPEIRKGAFRAFFVFDVADTIDLPRLRTVGGSGVARAPLQLRREASTEFIQYPVAPLIVPLPANLERGETLRAKLFDFGVISIRISVPFSGSWRDFAALGRRLRNDPTMESRARDALEGILAEIAPALDDPHSALLEDYFIFEVDRFLEPVAASDLTRKLGAPLAQLLRFEDHPLGSEEQAEALRTAFSYYDDDLVVVQWDAAFVYDRPEGADAVVDILEFANSQLVEYRTYDARLDEELDVIYAMDTVRSQRRFRRGYEAAERVRFLLVDILELTDRTSNALKIIGDTYYARLYRATAGRLGLADWQRQIDTKVRSVSEIYRVLQDRAQYARSEFLEIVIVALIAVEIVLGVVQLVHH